jgi:hypothetical protein
MIMHASFAKLGAKHGLTMNGKLKGSLTRVVVNVARTIGELKPVHESFNSSAEKRVLSARIGDAGGSAPPELIYEATRLKTLISNKSFHSF